MPALDRTPATYGPEHRAAARALKRAMHDGQPCCRCHLPMWRWQLKVGRNDRRGIDADHHSMPRVLGGLLPDALAHRTCNRSAGATLGNSMRAHGPRTHGPHPTHTRRAALPQW